jgi:DnaJ family protein C protein 9
MEDHIAKQLQAAFGEKTIYEILEVESTASTEDIKKNYKKLALKYHPDKGGSAEHFKALSVAHSILSDPEKRKQYDETGNLDQEDTSQEFEHWYEYFRNLFPKLTISKINEFSGKYKGSDEEKTDVITEYEKHSGDLKKIMDSVILAEEEDTERICTIIDAAIDAKTLKSTAKYVKSRAAVEKSLSQQPTKRKRKSSAEAEERAADELAQLIANKNKGKGSAHSVMSGIFAKYGGKDQEGEGQEATDELSDEAFEALRNKISKKPTEGGAKKKGKK